jgi:uncharacterized protein YciI
MAFFVVTNVNGPGYDESRHRRDQDGWLEHAAFMDRLVDEGFAIMGGPLEGGTHVLLIVQAADEQQVRARLADDPWRPMGILTTAAIQRWDVWLDGRIPVAAR